VLRGAIRHVGSRCRRAMTLRTTKQQPKRCSTRRVTVRREVPKWPQGTTGAKPASNRTSSEFSVRTERE